MFKEIAMREIDAAAFRRSVERRYKTGSKWTAKSFASVEETIHRQSMRVRALDLDAMVRLRQLVLIASEYFSQNEDPKRAKLLIESIQADLEEAVRSLFRERIRRTEQDRDFLIQTMAALTVDLSGMFGGAR